MKTVCPYLAGCAAISLIFVAVVIPAPVRAENETEPKKLPVAPAPRHPISPYIHTALGAVIEANGGYIPANGVELTTTLAKLGDFVQLPVTFSAVALHSGLSHPRVVITMRPARIPGQTIQVRPSSDGWGGSSQLARALGSTAANVPYLEGRLFLAANTELDNSGQPFIQTVEFISWNSRKQKFDFGVIEGMGGKPEVKMLDGSRCFSCHKNHGPILGVSPWSNTAHTELVRATSAKRFRFAPRLDLDGKENAKRGVRDDIDGLKLLTPNAPEVDAAIRQGAEVLRDRERFKLLAHSADGRKVLVLLLEAIVAPGKLDSPDMDLKVAVDRYNLIKFLQDAHLANKKLAPSTLADFSPAGPVSREIMVRSSEGLVNQVKRYDAIRAAGNHGLMTQNQPSNPKAFIRSTAFTPRNTSQLVNPVMLARAIGLSEDDRSFLSTTLKEAAEKLNGRSRSPAALARAVFTGPSFAKVLKSGVLPERDDFKDLFVAGLVDEMRTRMNVEQFWHSREKYAATPQFDPTAPPEKEIVVLPSHACLGCHDIRTERKSTTFSPIPQLAFDPFDPLARSAWLKTADWKKRKEVLSRLLQRLETDKDMPPEDSTEAEMYRGKDPTGINAVKDWVEAELQNLKR